jgi:hypothetical protein
MPNRKMWFSLRFLPHFFLSSPIRFPQHRSDYFEGRMFGFGAYSFYLSWRDASRTSRNSSNETTLDRY